MVPRTRCKSATTSRPHRRICSLPSAIQRERYRILLHPNLQPSTVCRGGWVEAEVATRMLPPHVHLREHLLVHDTRILDRRRKVDSAVVLVTVCTNRYQPYPPTGSRRPVRFKPGMWERERSRLEVGRYRFLADVSPQRSNEMLERRRLGLHLWFQSGALTASGSWAAYQASVDFFQNIYPWHHRCSS